jgi:hypothetical protein
MFLIVSIDTDSPLSILKVPLSSQKDSPDISLPDPCSMPNIDNHVFEEGSEKVSKVKMVL